MGNSRKQLHTAIQHIEKKLGKTIRVSSLYQTAAWGNTNQPDFLNQVILVESNQTPSEAIQTVLSIEEKMGRIRTQKNAPRIIDIDILFFNKVVISEPRLIVPHPEIQNRRFVLIPLNELSPNFKHPVLKKSVHQLLLSCKDELNVKKF